MDVTRELGVGFAETIREAVGNCGALAAVIGDEWRHRYDDSGNRGIDDPAHIHRSSLRRLSMVGSGAFPHWSKTTGCQARPSARCAAPAGAAPGR